MSINAMPSWDMCMFKKDKHSTWSVLTTIHAVFKINRKLQSKNQHSFLDRSKGHDNHFSLIWCHGSLAWYVYTILGRLTDRPRVRMRPCVFVYLCKREREEGDRKIKREVDHEEEKEQLFVQCFIAPSFIWHIIVFDIYNACNALWKIC